MKKEIIKYLFVFLLVVFCLPFISTNEVKAKNKICEFEYSHPINKSNIKYEGECSEFGKNTRNGWGKEIIKSDNSYNGTIIYSYFTDDYLNGPSKSVYPCPGEWCGHVYVSLYKKGVKYWSKLKFPNGHKMIGEALADTDEHRLEGWGKLYFSYGETYEGQFSNNYRNGLGINTWSDGRVNEGEWVDDKFKKAKKVNLSYLNDLIKKYEKDIKTGESLDDNRIQESYGLAYVSPEERNKIPKKKELDKPEVSEKKRVEKKPQAEAPKKETKPLEQEEKERAENPKVRPSPNDLVKSGSGTGFFINEEGFLITNQHVVEFCDVIEVLHKKILKKTLIVASNKRDDLAIIKVNVKPKYFFSFANQQVDILDNIHVAGFPFGLYSSSVKAKSGTVSSLTGMNDDYSIMEIDAPVSLGNSGGPVISKDSGGVVGVIVGKFPIKAAEELETTADDINFAIKASIAKDFLKAHDVKFHVQNNNKFVKEDLRKIIKTATVYISCSITRKTEADLKKNQNKLSTKQRTFFRALLNE